MVKYLNLFLFAGMIIMNYLANALPLNNVTTGQLSDSYPNLFVPAGLTFSIWGIIYILLAFFCVIQFTGANQVIISKITWLFALTCILNSLWIVSWHYRMVPLSLLIMVALLTALILINIRINGLSFSFIKAAFGVYLGWICIATIANVTTLLVNYGWTGFGVSEEAWAIIMILTGAAIVSYTLFRFTNPYIGLSVIWAFVGIAIKRQEDYRSIFVTAIAALAIVAAFTAWGFFRKGIAS